MNQRVSRVLDNLWVGSAPSRHDQIDAETDVLVLCASEYQPDASVFPRIMVLHAPFDDDELTAKELTTALDASKRVAIAVREGRRVWVTCMAGLNRSAFVAALAMRRLGWEPTLAIDAIRDARGPVALSNPYFETLVRELTLLD